MIKDQLKTEVLEKILKIVGHSEEEAKELSEKMVKTIIQSVLFSLLSELDESKMKKLVEQFTIDGNVDKLIEDSSVGISKDEISKLILGASADYAKKYFERLSPGLTPEQKIEISKVLVIDNA